MSRKRSFHLILIMIMLFLLNGLYAQFYFGRNKIQYEQFDWQILKTDHFHIYYYKEEKAIAGMAASILENAYADLELKFNHTLRDTVPMIIYSNHIHFQQTNVLPMLIPEGVGGFFEHRKGRVVIPYMGDLSLFRNVLVHELAHVFTFSKIMDPVRLKNISRPPAFPHWFTEGLAEWWSVGWDTQSDMVIRDRLLHGTLIPLNQVGGYLSYKEGQSFLRWFEQVNGIEQIRWLMENTWIYDSFEDALAFISHKSFKTLQAEWNQSLRQYYSHALTGEDPATQSETVITREGLNIFPVSYLDSEQKRHVIYISSRDGYPAVYDQPLYEEIKKRIKTTGKSPNMESLHFLQSGFDIFKDQIVLGVKAHRHDVLHLLDRQSGKILQTISHDSLVTIHSPRFSKDGNQITFTGQHYNGNSDIYLFTISSNNLVNLTNDIFTDRDPSFTDDGKTILFSSDRDNDFFNGGLDLYALNLKSNEIRLLLDDDHTKSFPNWDSSASAIHFLSDKTGMNNIWSLHISEKRLTQRTNFHTGISQFRPMNSDSVVAGVFQNYSYQVAALELDSIHSVSWTPSNIEPKTQSIWPPSIGKGERTRNMPFKLRYKLDFAQTAVAMDPIYGILGGAQLSLSDQLGNRYIHFLLNNSAQIQAEIMDHWNLAVTYLNMTGRPNWGISAFHFANEYFNPYQAFFFERTAGIRGALNFPYSIHRRIEMSSSLWYSMKDNYIDDPEKFLFISNFFSLIHDNSLWTMTGPLDGWRARITAGPTYDFSRGRYHNFTTWIDLRNYWQIRPRITLAQRTMIWMNEGKDIQRYYIGGSWGIRGYRWSEIKGRKMVMLNHELRFPFAQKLEMNFKSGSFWLAPIRGAIFLDLGNAWEQEFPGFLSSTGLGFRAALMGALVFRLDLGWKAEHVNIRPQEKFVQFFFGWDF